MAALTLGLQNLRRQVNDAFPARDKASDGWIGDAAHQAETSGHNPDDTAGSRPAWNGDPDALPEVRAWDMDSDLGQPGVDAQDVVDHIRRLPGLTGVLRYMIFNHRMYHERDGFAPTAYDGASGHEEHIHFEGAWAQAADSNTTFDYRLEDIPMPLNPADLSNIRGIIREELAAQRDDIATQVWATKGDVDTTAAGVNLQPRGSILDYTSGEHHRIEEKVDKVLAIVTPVATTPPAK